MAQGEAARALVSASHGGCWQLPDALVWMEEALFVSARPCGNHTKFQISPFSSPFVGQREVNCSCLVPGAA